MQIKTKKFMAQWIINSQSSNTPKFERKKKYKTKKKNIAHKWKQLSSLIEMLSIPMFNHIHDVSWILLGYEWKWASNGGSNPKHPHKKRIDEIQ